LRSYMMHIDKYCFQQMIVEEIAKEQTV
jgi:hypothetical protein